MGKLSRFFDWLIRVLRRFASWWWSIFRKQSITGKLIFASVSLCVVCFVCSLPSIILSPSPTPTPQPISVSENNPTSESIQAPARDIPVPTNTPLPTNIPTPMPEPTLTPTPTKIPPPTKTPTPAYYCIALKPEIKDIYDECGFLSETVVYHEGEIANTTLDQQSIQLILDKFQETQIEKRIRGNRFFLTSFTLFNNGERTLSLDTEEIFQAKTDTWSNFSGPILRQETPDVIVVDAGQEAQFEIEWRTGAPTTVESGGIDFAQQTIYIAVNAPAIEEWHRNAEPVIQFIPENVIFFRLTLPERKR